MKKKIYHGSIKVIEKPVFGYGNIHNDYGLGFYCTEDLELAKEWAVNEIQDGYANIYEVELEGLNILNLNQPNYCFLHWLALLLANRTFSIPFPLANEAKEYIIKNFLIDVSKYDVIIGYRADDAYFKYAVLMFVPIADISYTFRIKIISPLSVFAKKVPFPVHCWTEILFAI